MIQIELDVLRRAERALNKINEIELRDVFAMQAMNGMISMEITWASNESFEKIAQDAYTIADAMLEARRSKNV